MEKWICNLEAIPFRVLDIGDHSMRVAVAEDIVCGHLALISLQPLWENLDLLWRYICHRASHSLFLHGFRTLSDHDETKVTEQDGVVFKIHIPHSTSP